MKKQKPTLFYNEKTGGVVATSKKAGRLLGPEYQPIKFVKNQEGVPVMRFSLQGATVDIIETEVPLPEELAAANEGE